MTFHTKARQGYDVLDVSRYIINYCIDKNQPITNGKLQKLLFYVQSSFLVELGQVCFSEDIIAWKLGAYIRKSYDAYSYNGLQPINHKQEINEEICYDNKKGRIIFKTTSFNQNEIFDKSHLIQINKVLDAYLNVSVYDLINKNLNEEPFINADYDEVISTDIIRTYYTENKNKLYQL